MEKKILQKFNKNTISFHKSYKTPFPSRSHTKTPFPSTNCTKKPFPSSTRTKTHFPSRNCTKTPFPSRSHIQTTFPSWSRTKTFASGSNTKIKFSSRRRTNTPFPEQPTGGGLSTTSGTFPLEILLCSPWKRSASCPPHPDFRLPPPASCPQKGADRLIPVEALLITGNVDPEISMNLVIQSAEYLERLAHRSLKGLFHKKKTIC